MGLDYLNKKVWHPGSMKNIQKVWDAQQAQLQVIKRQKQRAKKLQDQQYNQQMKRIQVQAGLIPRSHLDRMDWMYDLGNKLQQQKNNQQFVLGNKKPGKKDVKHIFQEQSTNRKCQDFVLLHEDPMYAIQKQQMKARETIMNNPVQMRSIIRQVEEDYLKIHPKNKKHSQIKNSKHRKQKQNRNHSSSNSPSSHKKRNKNSPSSSSSDERSRNKKNPYQSYLQNKFSPILKQINQRQSTHEYNKYRKPYKTQIQMDEQQRKQKLQEMRANAKRIAEKRSPSRSQTPQQKSKDNYEKGLTNIRNKSFEQSTTNK